MVRLECSLDKVIGFKHVTEVSEQQQKKITEASHC